MGLLYTVECVDCGYVEDLQEGVGMAGASFEPRLCATCRRIVAVQTTEPLEEWGATDEDPDELDRCPSCRGDDVRPWGAFGEDGAPIAGPCPVCAGAVNLHPTGLWD